VKDRACPCFLGIDVGSVTTKAILVTGSGGNESAPGWGLAARSCLPTAGRPLETLQEALREILDGWAAARTAAGDEAAAPDPDPGDAGAGDALGQPEVCAVGATGSGRALAGTVTGADLVKNEITAHAVAALSYNPGVQTVIEIGGQDSKLIILREGVVVDFAMNTVCAAGTGSFLDRQAARLDVPIEEFGRLAGLSESPVRIAGRCAVFAESDMIHKQQIGHSVPDIVRGLCHALVRNYLNNLGKGKDIHGPVVFQGGVAANVGMKAAFEETLGLPVTVPPHHSLMGAIGAALLAREAWAAGKVRRSTFRGFEVAGRELVARGFDCRHCPNQCEVIQLYEDGKLVARWGGRCGRWELAAS
jgi:predicted CoA-substrate-specific enzyme activase